MIPSRITNFTSGIESLAVIGIYDKAYIYDGFFPVALNTCPILSPAVSCRCHMSRWYFASNPVSQILRSKF